MTTAKFVDEVVVTDPDTKAPVAMSIFKHEGGGMFALDSSYIEQVLPEDGDCIIPDPFETFVTGVYISNDGVKLTGI